MDLEAWSSEDLATWTWEGVIWSPTPGSWNDHPTIWAPHVHHGPDGFSLYYSANGRVGLAVASDPAGPFTDLRPTPFAGGGAGGFGDGVYGSEAYDVEDPADFLADAEEYAIDAWVHPGADGALTLYVSALTPWSVIAAVPMRDPHTLEEVAPTVVLPLDPDASWEGLNREGPVVVEADGVFHLMYSGNYWWTTSYAIGSATGPGPLGPFTRDALTPWFASTPDGSILGPGHHSVVDGPGGDRLLFYHAKVDATEGGARRTRAAPVAFDGPGAPAWLAPPPGAPAR